MNPKIPHYLLGMCTSWSWYTFCLFVRPSELAADDQNAHSNVCYLSGCHQIYQELSFQWIIILVPLLAWKYLDALDKSNDITNHSYHSSFVLKVVFHSSPSQMQILWFPPVQVDLWEQFGSFQHIQHIVKAWDRRPIFNHNSIDYSVVDTYTS